MKARPIQVAILGLLTASLAMLYAASPPQQRSISLAPSSPLLVAPDPFANVANSADGLKPARPFWYVVDSVGLTIMRLTDNTVLYRVPWPTTTVEWVATPDGEFVSLPVPPGGWEPVGMVVSYPTEEALASNSETPATYVYVVMKHSGVQWASNPNPPDLQDPGIRDTLVPATSEATESSMLLQVDVTDPSFLAAPPVVAAAILGHGAGQPAIDPSTGNVYVGNMPSTSLPTNLQAFVSVIAPLAPPVPEVGIPGVPAAPEAPLVNVCGPEHPDEGLLLGEPYVWACGESGDGPAVWEFQNLPPWLYAHVDKANPVFDGHQNLDGLLYGVPPVNGTWTFQARVIDYGDPENGPQTSDWTTWTVNVMPTGVAAEAEAGFEAGVPGGMGVPGTGTCEPAPTATPGSIVPRWIDVQPAYIGNTLKGCFVMGTAPISGEYYEFTLPNFHFLYPFDREAVIFSGTAVGAYGFDPLPAGVSLSGLAWHQIEKIHDPSTEADIVNAEFIGVEPFTGQLYRILLPQGSIEVGTVVAPPETSVELDEITPEGQPLLASLLDSRTEIGNYLIESRTVKFGDLVVEADRDIFVSAVQILDPTGADPTVIPIGGPAGSTIENGALIKVSGGTASTIDLPGVQANSLALNSDLRPAIPGVEPGQTDNGILWVTGTTTGNVAMFDIVAGQNQPLAVEGATSLGGVSVDTGTGIAYVAGMSLQSVIVFGTAPVPPRAPVIWGISPNVGIELTFDLGVNASFNIVTTGSPTPALFCGTPVETCGGILPPGLTFTENGDGTATIAGTPSGTIGGDYTFTLTARNGVSPDASTPVIVTVNSPPIITSPNTVTWEVGVAGSFTITTAGPAPSFTCPIATGAGAEAGGEPVLPCPADPPAWVTFTDNDDGTGTLTGIPPGEGSYSFPIIVTNDIPPDATQTFTLVVVTPGTHYAPQVVTQPLNQTVTEGEMAAFAAAASGYPVPTVQWQISTDGVAWSDIAGATSTGYTIPVTTTAMSGSRYRAVFTNDMGTATSNAALLTVNTAPPAGAPVVTVHPSNQTVTAGQSATFTAGASGNPTPTVQWQVSSDLGMSWSNLASANSTSYTIPVTTTVMSSSRFRAVFTNSAGTANSNAATLTVNAASTPPSITSPNATTFTVGSAGSFMVTTTGSPTPTLSYWGTLPGGVTFTPNGNGNANLAGTPIAGSQGNYPFTITATNTADSVTQNFTLIVNAAANNPPVATAQSVTTAEDAAKAITLSGNDPDGDALTYAVVTAPQHGTLSGTAPALQYTPAANYNGPDSFAFTVNDGKVASAAATVTITVTAVNDPPVATAQSVTTAEDTAKAITLSGNDPDGDALTYAVVTAPQHGTLSGTAPALQYTPAANYNGPDSFTFKVNDGTVDSVVAVVTITVTPVNTPVIITTTSLIGGTAGQSYSSQLQAEGGTQPYTWSTNNRALPQGLRLSSAGLISGRAGNNSAGTYTFTVQVTDSARQSASKSLTLIIAPRPPR